MVRPGRHFAGAALVCAENAVSRLKRTRIDHGWREVADTALAFVKRFA
jgi:hypothetical protein